jgi:hypothetical protein
VGVDGPEEVAVEQNGKKFKVWNKPPAHVCSSVIETYTSHVFPVTKKTAKFYTTLQIHIH